MDANPYTGFHCRMACWIVHFSTYERFLFVPTVSTYAAL